jgi:hypothetical protein
MARAARISGANFILDPRFRNEAVELVASSISLAILEPARWTLDEKAPAAMSDRG